ncbi:MAG: Gfo/Idh/MocA family oxidoreductase [Candidatus Omnitrophota bacterium]
MNRKRLLKYGKNIYYLYKERGLRGLLNMETKKIRTVFVGCGKHATENIYPSLRYCPVDLLATCAMHKENAERNAKWFGAPRYYDDYRKMLDEEKPDAAIIVVNARSHAKMACEALKRGVHVFIEKAPSVDLQGTEKIIEESKKSQRMVMVGFQKRFAPAYVKAKEITRSKGFGALKHYQTRFCTGRMISGENFILEIGIHHLDLARYFCGEVESLFVSATGREDGEAYAINIKFKNGAVGSMILSEQQSWFHRSELIEITGRGNCVEIDNVNKLTYFNKGIEILGVPVSHILQGERGRIVWEPNFAAMTTENSMLYRSGTIGELRHFCDCVLNRKIPHTSIEDSYKTMQLVAEVLKLAGV